MQPRVAARSDDGVVVSVYYEGHSRYGMYGTTGRVSRVAIKMGPLVIYEDQHASVSSYERFKRESS